MKASRFSEAQKAFILKQGADGHARGRHMPEGRHQPSDLFQLEKKYDGLLPTEIRRLKQFEDENSKLKRIVAVARQGDAAGRAPPKCMTPSRAS